MRNVRIREANENDLSAIRKLTVELIETLHYDKGIEIDRVLENCQDLLTDANSHFLVAEMDRVVVGFINITTRKALLHRGPSGVIDELVVAKTCRGRGIGKRLLSATIEKCRQLGCSEVEVSTEKENARAIEFYMKCGFNERGLLFERDL